MSDRPLADGRPPVPAPELPTGRGTRMLRVTGPDGGCLFADAAWLEFRGRGLDEEVGGGWHEGVHPEDMPAIVRAQRAALAEGRPYEIEYRLRNATGRYRRVRDRGAARIDPATGEAREVIHAVAEVTSDRRVDDRRRSTAVALLDAFVVLAPLGGSAAGVEDLRVVHANARAAAALGVPVEEVVGRRLGELVPAQVAERLAHDAARVLAGGRAVRREERSELPGHGGRAVEVELAPVEGGEVGLVWRDPAGRGSLAESLAASEDRCRELADEVPVGIFETDAEGRCTFVNRAWCALSGLGERESLGLGWLQVIHPDDRERVWRVWEAALAAGTGCDQEFRLARPDGATRVIACHCVPRRGGAAGYLGTVRDVTEERRAEHQDAALRRVAVAVAEESPAATIFAMVAEEAARLLDAEVGLVNRFDAEGAVCVGGWDVSGMAVNGVWSLTDDNLVSRVRRTGAPARVADFGRVNDPAIVAWARRRGLHGGVAAPVRVGGRLWGSVATMTSAAGRIPERAEEQLDRFASLVSLAIAHAEERERMVEETLAEIFTGELDAQETLQAIITSSRRALRAERATCYLYSRAGTNVGEMHTTERDPARLRALRAAVGRDREQLPLDRLLTGHGPLLAIEDVRAHPSVPPRLADAIGAGALIGIRLQHPSARSVGGAQLGSLWLAFAAPRTFSPRERLAARSLAAVAAIALANARLRTATDLTLSTRSRGEVDDLTGLPTHRTFQERLGEQYERFRRAGVSLAVALIDLDHFSAINTRFGHRAGDEVLREAAVRLAELAGTGDVVARVGGEQFAWLMIGTGGAEAWRAADRARAAIGAGDFPGVGRVTASVGVAELSQAGTAPELYRLAGGALYWAKHHGRDITFSYSPDVVEVLSAEEQAERLRQVQALQSIRVLARAVDAKDTSTRRHSERVAELAALIASEVGWDDARQGLLREAGLVHDVGKIGIPDAVLFKTGALDPPEYELIKTHAVIGAEMVNEVLTEEQVAWVRHHHERVDGRGYPDGMGGEAVPLGARVLGLADAWDVMTSARPYSEPLDHDTALEECRRCAGAQFDPDLVDVLARLVAEGRLPVL